MIKGKIKETVQKGDLAIIAYTVLGCPDTSTSKKAIDILSKHNVTIFETAIPVTQRCSSQLSELIKQAHATACLNNISLEDVLDSYFNFRPNLYILHEGTKFHSFEDLLRKMKGRVDGVLVGWQDKHTIKEYYQACQDYGIDMVGLVSPNMNLKEIVAVLQYTEGFIYLTAASKTGGRLFPTGVISHTIKTIKSIRDDLPICCGFGLKSPGDVRGIGLLEDCDGVIIGTALLDALSKGLEQFENFIKDVTTIAKGLKNF